MSTLNVNCTCSVMFSGVLHYMYIIPLNILAQGGVHNILRFHALSFPTLHIPFLLIQIFSISICIGPASQAFLWQLRTVRFADFRLHWSPGSLSQQATFDSALSIRPEQASVWQSRFTKKKKHVSTFGLIET